MREQSIGADQIRSAIMQLDQVSQRNSDAAGRAAKASTELNSEVSALRRVLDHFTIGEPNSGSRELEQTNEVHAEPVRDAA